MFLDKIIRQKKEELKDKKNQHSLNEIKSKISELSLPRDFKAALVKNGKPIPKLIAEIKKASPSKGIIREEFDPQEIAKIYEENGASAISVLTDEAFFMGRLDYLSQVKEVTTIPLLRKDFIIDEYQIYEARAYNADAVLLIAAVLEKSQMKEYLALSCELGLTALVEVHNLKELDKALLVGADIIGINNRDLKTFEVNLQTTLNLIKDIPNDKIIVSESGIRDYQDVQLLKEGGIDAILVGETLMKSKDIGNKVKELLGNKT